MKGWVTIVIWLLMVAGGIYFPFFHSPEMTNVQLLINYWWFYLPAMAVMVCLMFFNHTPRRQR